MRLSVLIKKNDLKNSSLYTEFIHANFILLHMTVYTYAVEQHKLKI